MAEDKNNLLEKIWVISQQTQKQIGEINKHVAVLNQEMGDVQKDIKEINKTYNKEMQEIKENYVSQDEFSPIKKVVYCAVGSILMAVLTAILGLVILKTPVR